MAKADLPKAEMFDFRAEIGGVIERTRLLAQLSLKEFADRVRKDERQVARWISGAERPQMDALWAVPELREFLIQAFAELSRSEAVTVETSITIRRRA